LTRDTSRSRWMTWSRKCHGSSQVATSSLAASRSRLSLTYHLLRVESPCGEGCLFSYSQLWWLPSSTRRRTWSLLPTPPIYMTLCHEHLANFQKWHHHDGSVGIWSVSGELATSSVPWWVDNNCFGDLWGVGSWRWRRLMPRWNLGMSSWLER
jgi:hypothetical protein